MRFLVLFAVLLLASCGLPGTGPAEWTVLPPVKQAELETSPAIRPPRPTPPSEAPPSAAPANEEVAEAAPAREDAAPARPDVEELRPVVLTDAQAFAVQAGIRDSLRDEGARLDRVAAGQNSLGVVFACGYADVSAPGGRENQAFRGVLIGKDNARPRFVPVSSTGASGKQETTAQVCAAQGIPLSAAAAANIASARNEEATPEPAADVPEETATAAAPAPEIPVEPAQPIAPSAPLPKVVLTEPQIKVVQAGVRTSLKADSAVFGRMLAAADAKGGIVVCGYVSPAEGEGGGAAIQPFTGVLIGQGDRRNFVPVGFGRDDVEKRQTMQVCASQGIPL